MWVNTTVSHKLMHGMRTLHLAVSTDGARSFSPPVTIVDQGKLSGRAFQGLDVSGDGKIYVAWLDSPAKRDANGTLVGDPSRPSTVSFSRSTDGGRSFGPSVVVSVQTPCPCCNVNVLAGQGDEVFVSWRDAYTSAANKSIRDIAVARSADGGQSFGAPVRVHDDMFELNGCVHVGAPMAIDGKGRIHIAWYTSKKEVAGMYYSVSSDRGRSFSAPLAIVEAEWVPPSRIEVAIDSKDDVWFTYEYPAAVDPHRATDDPIWRYWNATALIEVSKIGPDGRLLHSGHPLNAVDGKVPALATMKDSIIVLWGDVKNEVWASTASLPA